MYSQAGMQIVYVRQTLNLPQTGTVGARERRGHRAKAERSTAAARDRRRPGAEQGGRTAPGAGTRTARGQRDKPSTATSPGRAPLKNESTRAEQSTNNVE